MEQKSTFNTVRDALQQGIYAVINPFVKLLIRMGITPNAVTTIGLLGNIAATAIFAYAGYTSAPGQMHYGLVATAGAVIILFSTFDMLDGQAARIGGMASRFGALYDSVLDRYCELLTLGGIAYYLFCTGHQIGALVTFLAMVGSVMVSYVRARAEGLGTECKVGFMQRPERVVVTSIAALATGIAGLNADPEKFDAMLIMETGMGIIAVFANITAFARVAHCAKAMNGKR